MCGDTNLHKRKQEIDKENQDDEILDESKDDK